MKQKKPISASEFSISFGKALKDRRLVKRLSQEELGFICNIDRTYVSGVERGTRNPTLQIAWRLAKGLDTPLSTLIQSTEIIYLEEEGDHAL